MLASEVVERTYGWLYPGGANRPAADVLLTTIDASTLTIDARGRVGAPNRASFIEIESELIPIDTVAADTPAAGNWRVTALERGHLESAAAGHAAGARIYISPEFTRISIFNALRSIIESLYPWGFYRRELKTDALFTTQGVVSLDAGARDVAGIRVQRLDSRWSGVLQEGVDYDVLHESEPPALQLYRGGGSGRAMRIIQKMEFTPPATEATDLDTLEIPASLQPYLPIAIAGHLLAGRDISRLQTDEIRRAIAAAGGEVPFGAGVQISSTLLNLFRTVYLRAEIDRLAEKDPTRWVYVS